jgi:beta-glucosidase
LSQNATHATGQVTVSFDLQNSGKRKGAEVAQLYVHQQKSNVVQPIKSLRGFQRVELEPGETKHISLDLPAAQLSYYDVVTKKFIVVPGMFDVLIGSSAEDIRLHTQLEVN